MILRLLPPLIFSDRSEINEQYGDITYGWREIDIATLIAHLIIQQKIQIKYGGTVVGKDERRLVDFLRKKSEIDKAIVARRIAPSEELMRKRIDFLRAYLNVMDISSDGDGLICFVVSTFETKTLCMVA